MPSLPHDLIGTGDRLVVVIHGWLGGRRSFDSIRPHLDLVRFTYLFPDLRGYGEAVDQPGEFSLREAATDIIETVNETGRHSFAVAGHSMGGVIAQQVLVEAPDRVTKLVGIAPVPASGVSMDDRAWQLYTGASDDAELRAPILKYLTGARLPEVWVRTMVENSEHTTNSKAIRTYLESWTGADLRDRIEGNETPVLVIAGAHDAALPPSLMSETWLRWYPNSEMEVHHDAGHCPIDETPLALVARMEQFLGD